MLVYEYYTQQSVTQLFVTATCYLTSNGERLGNKSDSVWMAKSLLTE